MPQTVPVGISDCAHRFLATLERRAAVPTEEVEAIITGAGFPCFTPWLDFHERYAGYLELTPHDYFMWGLIHRDPYWLDPNKPLINSELGGKTWHIFCADGHPSFDYRLKHTGEFMGAPAESFDIHVERIALGWEFKQRGEFRAWSSDELRDPAFRKVFEERIKPHPVAEVSDRFSRYYLSDGYFVEESVKTGALLRGYERKTRHAEPSVAGDRGPQSLRDGRSRFGPGT